MDTNSIVGSEGVNGVIYVKVPITDELRRRIRILAAEEDKSSRQWMREAIELVVKRVEEKKNA